MLRGRGQTRGRVLADSTDANCPRLRGSAFPDARPGVGGPVSAAWESPPAHPLARGLLATQTRGSSGVPWKYPHPLLPPQGFHLGPRGGSVPGGHTRCGCPIGKRLEAHALTIEAPPVSPEEAKAVGTGPAGTAALSTDPQPGVTSWGDLLAKWEGILSPDSHPSRGLGVRWPEAWTPVLEPSPRPKPLTPAPDTCLGPEPQPPAPLAGGAWSPWPPLPCVPI